MTPHSSFNLESTLDRAGPVTEWRSFSKLVLARYIAFVSLSRTCSDRHASNVEATHH
jgi:hypothetical protein